MKSWWQPVTVSSPRVNTSNLRRLSCSPNLFTELEEPCFRRTKMWDLVRRTRKYLNNFLGRCLNHLIRYGTSPSKVSSTIRHLILLMIRCLGGSKLVQPLLVWESIGIQRCEICFEVTSPVLISIGLISASLPISHDSSMVLVYLRSLEIMSRWNLSRLNGNLIAIIWRITERIQYGRLSLSLCRPS